MMRCNVWVEDLVWVSFVLCVNTIRTRIFAWVNKQSAAAREECENDFRAHERSRARKQPQTNLRCFIYAIPSAAEWIYQNRTFNSFAAIRMKIFNIGWAKFQMIFNISLLSQADIRFVSCPCGRTGVHSSFRNMASFVEHAASLSSHRRYEKDRRINLPAVSPESWRKMQKNGKSRSISFFLLSGSFPSLFSYIWWDSLSCFFFKLELSKISLCLWLLFVAIDEYVRISWLIRASMCNFGDSTQNLWSRHPTKSYCEYYPENQCCSASCRQTFT